MVSEDNPGPHPRKRRLPWSRKADSLFDGHSQIYAQLRAPTAGHLRVGVIRRTGEWIEIDPQGVVLIQHGKRHILHMWGDKPSVYLPH